MITITSFTLKSLDYSTNGANFLIGNVGDKMRAIIEFTSATASLTACHFYYKLAKNSDGTTENDTIIYSSNVDAEILQVYKGGAGTLAPVSPKTWQNGSCTFQILSSTTFRITHDFYINPFVQSQFDIPEEFLSFESLKYLYKIELKASAVSTVIAETYETKAANAAPLGNVGYVDEFLNGSAANWSLLQIDGEISNATDSTITARVQKVGGSMATTDKVVCLVTKIINGIDNSKTLLENFKYERLLLTCDGTTASNGNLLEGRAVLGGGNTYADVTFRIKQGTYSSNESFVVWFIAGSPATNEVDTNRNAIFGEIFTPNDTEENPYLNDAVTLVRQDSIAGIRYYKHDSPTTRGFTDIFGFVKDGFIAKAQFNVKPQYEIKSVLVELKDTAQVYESREFFESVDTTRGFILADNDLFNSVYVNFAQSVNPSSKQVGLSEATVTQLFPLGGEPKYDFYTENINPGDSVSITDPKTGKTWTGNVTLVSSKNTFFFNANPYPTFPDTGEKESLIVVINGTQNYEWNSATSTGQAGLLDLMYGFKIRFEANNAWNDKNIFGAITVKVINPEGNLEEYEFRSASFRLKTYNETGNISGEPIIDGFIKTYDASGNDLDGAFSKDTLTKVVATFYGLNSLGLDEVLANLYGILSVVNTTTGTIYTIRQMSSLLPREADTPFSAVNPPPDRAELLDYDLNTANIVQAGTWGRVRVQGWIDARNLLDCHELAARLDRVADRTLSEPRLTKWIGIEPYCEKIVVPDTYYFYYLGHARGDFYPVFDFTSKITNFDLYTPIGAAASVAYRYSETLTESSARSSWAALPLRNQAQLLVDINNGSGTYAIQVMPQSYDDISISEGTVVLRVLTDSVAVSPFTNTLSFSGISQDTVLGFQQKINLTAAPSLTDIATAQYRIRIDKNTDWNSLSFSTLTQANFNASVNALIVDEFEVQFFITYTGSNISGSVDLTWNFV